MVAFFIGLMAILACPLPVLSAGVPFGPGEKLTFLLRWENIPAGEATLEVHPIETINGVPAYHFVMTAKSNKFVDIFYKIRDRIDAYADIQMQHSLQYKKRQIEGSHNKNEIIEFNWEKSQARYSDFGKDREPISLKPGSFDPLSAFYYTRIALTDENAKLVERPVTDGKKNIIGRAKVVGREMITLNNGQTFDTLLLEPEMQHIGGVFKESKGAKIQLWVTADSRCIPVQIKSKVVVGSFIGELLSTEGIK
jgi:hypothetical protein